MSLETRYEILEKIGSGSFATVYRARDNELGREVAIKQLHSEFLADPHKLDRFWQEAQLLASLQHPNIVTIFDIVRERGWLVMELMQSSLATRLAGRQVDLRALRATLAHGLRALKYLHSQGIIHGDIKPGNMMIDARRRVKIGDFGLARRVANAEGSLLKGTTKYMAPETVSDDFGDVGPQSDLYSLGFSAYDLMCGENFEDLFPGLNAKGRNQQLAWMMWHAAPDRQLPEIGRVLEGVPPDLAKVVQKLTQKDPALRYKSADEALSDLQIDLKLIGGNSDDVGGAPPETDDKRRLFLAAGALAISLGLSAFMLWPSGPPPKVEHRNSLGRVDRLFLDKNEFAVEDLGGSGIQSYKVPKRQSIYLLNEKKNILLADLKPGDHVDMEIDPKHPDLVVKMTVDRPVQTRGTLKEAVPTESRLVLAMEEGNTRDELPVRIPEAVQLKLNGQNVRLGDLLPGDRIEMTHFSELKGKSGRVLNALSARRTVTTVGYVIGLSDDNSTLIFQVGQGASTTKLSLPFGSKCKVTLNGGSERDGKPLEPDSIKPGDRVSLIHDDKIAEVSATRNQNVEGVTKGVDVENRKLSLLVSNGDPIDLLVDDTCEVTLALEKVTLPELRPYDVVRATYSEEADGTLRATTIDARRSVQTDRWAVVIGTQKYADESLSPLKTSLHDARLIHGMLVARYAMSERRVSLLIDAARRDWEQQLTQTLADATKNTHVMIFIVGHAYLGDDDRVYLAATDFDSTKMAQTGLPLDWLIEKIDACPAPEKLLVLDVTPLATGKDAEQQVAGKTISSKLKSPPKSTQIIVSCDDGQKSREWKDKQHGLFPWTVAEGIKGAADINRDLHLTPNELFDYLTEQAELAPQRVFHKQTPVLIGPPPPE